MTIPIAGKDAEQQEQSFAADENANHSAALKYSLAVSYSNEHNHATGSSKHMPIDTTDFKTYVDGPWKCYAL